jgi:ubiquinone/menaquinone biosynthesis C-methylase UbiE
MMIDNYYKTIAPFYDLIIPRNIKGICDSIEAIVKRYNSKKHILDLGCGTGRFSIELAKRGYMVTGLDIADEMLKVAMANAKKANVNIKFIKGDMRNFRLAKKPEIIWARGSIGDFIGVNDVKNALKNIKNNLTKKGLFIFDVRSDSEIVGEHSGGSKHEVRILKKSGKTIMFKFKRDVSRRSKIVTIRLLI